MYYVMFKDMAYKFTASSVSESKINGAHLCAAKLQ